MGFATATKANQGAVLRKLLAAGASVTRALLISEMTAISVAARKGRNDIVQTLLDRGADAMLRDKWNRSALYFGYITASPLMLQKKRTWGLLLEKPGGLQQICGS